MRNTVRLLLLGLLPLAVGYLINYVLMLLPFPLFFGSLLPLLLWAWLSGRMADSSENALLQALLLNAFGLVMLLLALLQELVLGAYWENILGLFSQLFFLTGLPLASVLLRPLTSTASLWPFYGASWLFLFLASLAGILLYRRKRQKKS